MLYAKFDGAILLCQDYAMTLHWHNIFLRHWILAVKFQQNVSNIIFRQLRENPPIGIILCTKASREQIELMELDKSGIAVAEYWTNLPPKALLEEKIRTILDEAQERLQRRKSLPIGEQKQLNYFFDKKDDEDY